MAWAPSTKVLGPPTGLLDLIPVEQVQVGGHQTGHSSMDAMPSELARYPQLLRHVAQELGHEGGGDLLP